MLNQNPKPYFNQIAMIESQYESKRKNLTNPSTSSLLQNKSPMRERENTNSINTPSRLQNGNNKVSLSPIRSRRNDSSMASVRSTAISRRKSTQNVCENHSNKIAKFMIDKDNQFFYFCDRCAIPLISNGFKLSKINEEEDKEVENPRIRQINEFLKQLEAMDAGMNKKKQGIVEVITEGQQQFDTQLEKIEEYYAQFYQIIDQHKRRVIEEMNSEFQKSTRSANSAKKNIEEAILDSTNMKEDILSSMNSVILEVKDHEFRSVMTQYYGNLNKFKEICNINQEQPIKVRTLSFKDGESVCHTLVEGLVIEWNDEDGEQEEQYQTVPGRPREEPESDRQNPIQCLQTQQRGKTNIKEIGNLFCSFDE